MSEKQATSTNNPYRSARLLYRAPETPDDDAFYQTINSDSTGYMNSNATTGLVPGNKDAKRYQEHVMNKALLGVVICLPPPSADVKPIPIGSMHMSRPDERLVQHRHTELGIDILPAYQGQGYGSEAMRWMLEWAFKRLNMHSVRLRAFEWNEGAIKLYQKLGFTIEGRYREYLYHEGRYWDDIQFGMLDREWDEIRKGLALS